MQHSTPRVASSYIWFIHSSCISLLILCRIGLDGGGCGLFQVTLCERLQTHKLLTFNLTCTCLDGVRKLSEGNCRDTGRTCKLCPAWYLPDQPSCYDGTLNRCLQLALVVTSRAGSCKNQRRVFPASLLGTLTRCYVVIDVKANDGYKVVLVTKKPSI